MTYRGYLAILLAFIFGGVVLAVASDRINLHSILSAASNPDGGVRQFPVSQIYQNTDGTVYFIGQDGQILVRDPDGNLRTVPAASLPPGLVH